MNVINELCNKYTSLKEDDIQRIVNISEELGLISDLVNADVFIDCPTYNKDNAIVVAESKPISGKSMYKGSVVGQMALRINEPAVLRTIDTGMVTRDLKATTQEARSVRQTVEPIRNAEGSIIGVLIVEKDVTYNINNDIRMHFLAEQNEKINDILNNIDYKDEENITYNIDDAIIIFDEDGIVRFRNPGAEKLYKVLGYKENLIGMEFNNISLVHRRFSELIKNNDPSIFEVDVGEYSFQIKCIVQTSKTLKLSMFIRDITEVKKKEKELILKSVAIKEIHHRVKNNLQTIASLLRLQKRRSENPELRNALDESINRILSIAATHEILSHQGFDKIDVKEVVKKVSSNIVRCIDKDKQIEVNVDGDSIFILSDKATAIALAVNELTQNSLKYAFKGRDKGIINISIQNGQMYSTVCINDNGTGFDIHSINDNSLGLNIVKSLVKDTLNGNLNIYSDKNGTKVSFDFKN